MTPNKTPKKVGFPSYNYVFS